ncbi:TetR/AcrR family transcriptional regulator [Novipirellula sp. SH528]|uniref:TetR/AcrR family transcriptional regulator n=1 Tax=Novipirellula sp. SH528 TaxID=3454466 RepID=UPI003FA076F5
MSTTKRKSDARQRILETAERLFYAEGVRAVGIDRIISESEVAKMTLYNHFASKDELILAVLMYREEQFKSMFDKSIKRHAKKGLTLLEAFFAALKDWFRSPGFRGCSFINAAVELADSEHPASQFASAHKVRFHERIKEILVESEGAKAADVAPAISLVVEGAIITAVLQGTPDAADIARSAALSLIPKNTRKKS